MDARNLYPDIIISEKPFGQFVLETMGEHEDNLAWIDVDNDGEEYSFRRIRKEALKCANGLYKEGIRRGDVIALLSLNSCQQKVLVLALALCGATIVPLDSLLPRDVVEQKLLSVEPKVLFVSSEHLGWVGRISLQTTIFLFDKCEVQNSFLHFLNTGDEHGAYLEGEIDVENDILFMFCTSGTLGPSKLVQLTNQNAVAVLQLFRVACKRSKGSISCSAIPIFHIPSVGYTFGHLVQGCANVILSNYNVMKLLQIVQEYKVTHVTMYASTFLEIAKCEVVKNYDVSSLKVVEVGASVTSQETKLETKRKLNLTEVIELYGLTEAFPATVSDPILSKSGSVGFLLPNTKLKVEDIETRKRCVAGEFGEIMLSGPQVAKGYYKHPEATMFDKEGWLKTGDIGYFDAVGNVYITDRIKDVFKTPEGLQVFPSEIISILLIHPKIADAGVIGVPSNMGLAGEVPKAFIVKAEDTTLTSGDVIQFVKDKVAAYKQLRGGVTFVDRLPRSSSGKILKRILKEIE